MGITARAAINGLGDHAAAVLEALYAGRRGLCPASDFGGWAVAPGVETPVGAIRTELPALGAALRAYDTRQARLTAAAIAQMGPALARASARWGPDRVALLLGTSTAGVADTERAYRKLAVSGALPPDFDLGRQHAFAAILDVARALTGVRGPGMVISTACSSSGRVFGSALRMIRAGVVDAALVGGIDTLCVLTVRGFRALEVVSAAPCRPFAVGREGINVGEGAALLLLERDADAEVSVLGVGESSDAHHMTAPHPEGRGARAAMLGALAAAGVDADATLGGGVHVFAHGTGTPQNDAVEARAVADTLPGAPVVATKGATGHPLGAAGATSVFFAAEALARGVVPPSVGADPLDALGVIVDARGGGRAGQFALVNAFAFGGANVSVLLGRGGHA